MDTTVVVALVMGLCGCVVVVLGCLGGLVYFSSSATPTPSPGQSSGNSPSSGVNPPWTAQGKAPTLEDVRALKERYMKCFQSIMSVGFGCDADPQMRDVHATCKQETLDKLGQPVSARAEACIARKLGVALP